MTVTPLVPCTLCRLQERYTSRVSQGDRWLCRSAGTFFSIWLTQEWASSPKFQMFFLFWVPWYFYPPPLVVTPSFLFWHRKSGPYYLSSLSKLKTGPNCPAASSNIFWRNLLLWFCHCCRFCVLWLQCWGGCYYHRHPKWVFGEGCFFGGGLPNVFSPFPNISTDVFISGSGSSSTLSTTVDFPRCQNNKKLNKSVVNSYMARSVEWQGGVRGVRGIRGLGR